MKRQLLVSALVVISNVLLITPLSSDAATNPYASMTPSQILITGANAEVSAGSVRVTDRIAFPGVSSATAILNTSLTASQEQTSARGQKATIRIIGSKDFLLANEKYYIAETGATNLNYVNRWVLIPKGNPLYVRTETNQLMQPLLESVIQLFSPKDLGVTTFYGHQVVAISGILPKGSVAPGATQKVYVATSTPSLIIGYSITTAVNGVKGTITAVFSNQGVKVNAPVPAKYMTAKA